MDDIANAFAYLALFGWPLVCVVLFNRLSLHKAIIWSLLGGYMLLPSNLEINAPVLPPLDKMSITALTVLVLCWVYGWRVPRPQPSYLLLLFGLVVVVSPILTSFTNSYELHTASGSIPGFYPLTGLKFAGRHLMLLVPMYIGFRYLSTDDARAALLTAIPTAMLVYSIPMLFEIRMSPQLHRWVYGYFPSNFAQQMRYGGFRPVVFFSHGLALALFTAVALLAALILLRSRTRVFGFSSGFAATCLSCLLLLCKSLGPTMYAVILAPVILLTKPRFWVKIGCVASLFVCAYPILRTIGATPIDVVMSVAHSVSVDRSRSFETRLQNEEQLLAKAKQKPLVGWGEWGRNRIYDQWTGEDISRTDGAWILELGTFGWIGYLGLFGLLAAAEILALKGTGKQITQANINRGGLALLLAVYIVDSIPNATDLSLIFLIAGAAAATPRAVRTKAVSRIVRAVRSVPHAAAAAMPVAGVRRGERARFSGPLDQKPGS